MNHLRVLTHKASPSLQIIFSLIWLSTLSATDSYFSIYVLIAFASFYLQIRTEKGMITRLARFGLMILSFFFAFAVYAANYPLFTSIGDPAVIGRSTSILMNLINSCLNIAGGLCVFFPVLRFFFTYYPTVISKESNQKNWVSYAVFFSLVLIYIIHLFLVEYPGNITEDPFTQISEMVSGSYSNFNTYWHTVLFEYILKIGYIIFSDFHASLALFCTVQAVILAFAFTFSLATMNTFGVPKWILFISYLIYAVVPYNIALSITVWKDVLYAAGCLLMISAWLRILKKLGNNELLNYAVFIFGSLLFLLSRTNGWIIYLVTFVAALVFCRWNHKLITVMGCLAVLGWALLNPMLTFLGVEGGDKAESLSIPIQQVSRVIAEGCELTDEEEMLLSRVVDLEEVPALYSEWISDPMKVELRSKDYAYFLSNIHAYRDLWIKLGLRYPFQYFKAWVEQTKGYWNGGYDYFLYAETVTDNPYGVEKLPVSNPIASLFRLYFGLSRHLIFFEPLHSIGLHVWIVFLCFLLNIVKKREQFVISIPLVLLVVGLWFGTPVYCSFRYVYPLFVSFPLIVSTALCEPEVK